MLKLKLPTKMAPTGSDVFDCIHARNAKLFSSSFLSALKNAVEAMKRLRNETKNYFGYMKIEAKSPNGWVPRGGVEEDYTAVVVTVGMAQGRMQLVAFLVNRMEAYGVKGPTVERLTKSAMLYLKEISLMLEKAHQMIHDHYVKGGVDEEA